MDTRSKPSQPDNAEEAAKCPVCGASVATALSQNVSGDKVECDACGTRFELQGAVHGAVSNEDY
jgi:transcription elongation factor Elf1